MATQVLLIEDDVDLSRELQEYLARRGYKCKACGTIGDAEAVIEQMQPDVVLSDICLPDGDGVIFCMTNAPGHPKARWLLMSGNQELVREGQRTARPDAAVTIVDKPVTMRLLNDFIRSASAVAAD